MWLNGLPSRCRSEMQTANIGGQSRQTAANDKLTSCTVFLYIKLRWFALWDLINCNYSDIKDENNLRVNAKSRKMAVFPEARSYKHLDSQNPFNWTDTSGERHLPMRRWKWDKILSSTTSNKDNLKLSVWPNWHISLTKMAEKTSFAVHCCWEPAYKNSRP